MIITNGTWHDLRVIRCLCVIAASRKLGLRRCQKTFMVKTVAPKFTIKTARKLFTPEARRWEKRVLMKEEGNKSDNRIKNHN